MITLVKFYAPWCKPCLAFSPIVNAYVSKNEDVILTEINIDVEQELVAQYGIHSIPTIAVIKYGDLLDIKSGSMTGPELEVWVDEFRNI